MWEIGLWVQCFVKGVGGGFVVGPSKVSRCSGKTREFPTKCLYIWMRVFMSLVFYTVRISCLATVPICVKLATMFVVLIRLFNVLRSVCRN